DTRILKNDATTTVGIVNIDGSELAIKRYNIKGFSHALKRSIRPSRAALCWEHAHMLLAAGICTPPPVAMIEKRYGFFRSTAYFINEYTPAKDIFEYLKTADIEARTQIAENISALFQQLNHWGITHGDLKPENILIRDKKPVLLDLDSLRIYPRRGWFFKRAHQKDINRFLKNWEEYPDIEKIFERSGG
ncbi:MAG: lipopolysaccharide kinase InaA family protein, partial [Gammaproteobacteria bacterium]